jgi:hypothetical protein
VELGLPLQLHGENCTLRSLIVGRGGEHKIKKNCTEGAEKNVNWAIKKMEEQVKHTDMLKNGDKFNFNKISKQVQYMRQKVRYKNKEKKGKR